VHQSAILLYSVDSYCGQARAAAGSGTRGEETMRRSGDVGGAKPMKSLVAALCLLLLAGIPLASGQDTSKGSIWSGVFTDTQARRGEATYQSNCAACHGKTLQATNPDAPSLTLPSFGLSWHKKTVADLFTLMKTTMPLGAGGSLSDPEYLDIVAYILKFNGYPAGERELGPEVERLGQILIEPKK